MRFGAGRGGRGFTRTVRVMARHRRLAGVLLLACLAMALISAALPVALAWGLSAPVARQGGVAFALAVGVFLVGVVVWLLNRVRAHLTKRLVAETVLSIRLDAVRAAMGQDLAYYDKHGRGQVLSRLTNDLDTFGEATTAVLETLQLLLVIVVLLPVLGVLNWPMTLLVLGTAAALVVSIRQLRRRSRHSATAAARSTGQVTVAVTEAVAGLATARALGCEAYVAALAGQANADSYRASRRADLTASLLQPVLAALMGVTTALVVLIGGRFAASGVITVATWYLFLLAADRFTSVLAASATVDGQIQIALASVERVFAVADAAAPAAAQAATADGVTAPIADPAPARPAAAAGPTGAGVTRGHVVVRDLTMRYTSGVEALRGVSLDLPPGTHTGLVGPSGAGKTSLLRVLSRLHPFTAGEVLIDGRPLRGFEEAAFRRTAAFLPQRPQLFAGTVLENIRLADPGITDAAVRRLARDAELDGWLDRLPGGLTSEVGRYGLRLSLGERQLVALLRALAKRPRLVLLDEPTANVDHETDVVVRHALRRLLRDRTAIMIAHRLSTMRDLDLILVIEDGRLVERGTHAELSAGDGRYAALFRDYLREHVDVSR